MGKEIIAELVPVLERMEWSGSPDATSKGLTSYEIGLSSIDSYRGDPKVLASALRIFQSGESQPLAYAGVAYTLLAAAREPDGAYAPEGLAAAMAWLEKAQELEPDALEINFIEALIYAFGDRFEDARLILDFLSKHFPPSMYLLRGEIAYHERKGDVEETVDVYEQAMQRSENAAERLRFQHNLGDFYFNIGRLDEALGIYNKVAPFDTDNPVIWHKMSIIHYRQGSYQEAVRCNDKVLELNAGEAPEAEQMKQLLRRKLGTGILNRLLGQG